MANWTLERAGCIPRSLTAIMAIGMLMVFTIAAIRQDVSPYVPFISEAGAYPPESGIFSIVLYFSASMGLLALLIRFIIINECNQGISKVLRILSITALVIGIIAMLGMIVVAAYPMISIPTAHNIGALTLFIGCLIYGMFDTAISYKMHPSYVGIAICRIRLAVVVISCIAFLMMFSATPKGMSLWSGGRHSHWSGDKTPQDEGFTLLLVSAIGEWLLAFMFILYFLTFISEFTKVSVQVSVQILVPHFEQEVPNSGRAESTERTTLIS